MEKLSGKTALVTGSTDGVGRLVARKLGQAGVRVLVHGRDAERGNYGNRHFHISTISAPTGDQPAMDMVGRPRP